MMRSDRPSLMAEEKREARIQEWLSPSIEFDTAQAGSDYRARVERIVHALDLQEPDRVPIRLGVGFWPAAEAGMTPYEAMNDSRRAMQVWHDFNLAFQPDVLISPVPYTSPAPAFELIGYQPFSWPGHGVPKESGFQYNEKEWMLAEEYDVLINDPSAYLLQTYLPRAIDAFAGFRDLSSLFDLISLPFAGRNMAGWGSPEMVAGLERLAEAGKRTREWLAGVSATTGRLKAYGLPEYSTRVIAHAPFDVLADYFRGTKGILIDMFRCPDKVLAACERLVPVVLDWALSHTNGISSPLVYMPLHKGADGFMSQDQFMKFYWPTLRAVLLGLIDEGMIPFCFAEGRFGSRLETIMDLPPGKTVWLFDQTDLAAAKKTIGTVACIQGNMPLSLLHSGDPKEVMEHTRRMLDVAAPGGGYILDLGAIADGGRIENLHAMVDTAKEFGMY